MTEQEITSAVDELILLVEDGKPMEAFDKFYHEDLEKTDWDGVPHKGKAVNYQLGLEMLSKVKTVRDFSAAGCIVKGNRSYLVWSLDFDHADAGAIKTSQVAIQDWEEGKIIRERFIV